MSTRFNYCCTIRQFYVHRSQLFRTRPIKYDNDFFGRRMRLLGAPLLCKRHISVYCHAANHNIIYTVAFMNCKSKPKYRKTHGLPASILAFPRSSPFPVLCSSGLPGTAGPECIFAVPRVACGTRKERCWLRETDVWSPHGSQLYTP